MRTDIVHPCDQRPLPLWLNEGFAEYASRLARASYQRARNYVAHPRSVPIPQEQLIPLAQLTAIRAYPSGDITVFYGESERLVRFLVAVDRAAFFALLDGLARGESVDSALSRSYGGRFFDLDALEKEFVVYASETAKTIGAAN